ncbi:extracellular solute-binding protein, family 5 [Alkaliphilus metalliredigens QYMF]|uniref:Extracellular solute-binding protein, family 5 n=1 Tax=Alkaliphilus metalliredigens (strain QYMF) TaxID=293826 RepID=A6TMB2_ALKMQ|nr:ABC transporter substrate-binding protein [Alkaliphilus metalliredigens]ABR47330.1 extracellular solute-binding protein, family 5 [Alkaliphilus metalliredigens QYMF]
MKKKLVVLLVCMFLASLLTACIGGNETQGTTTDGNNGQESSTEEKILTFGSTESTTSLDPHMDWNGWYGVRYGITETLFKLNDSLVPEPWLAESYENIDGLTWKIILKDNVFFTNGEAVTAHKVVENMQRFGEVNYRAAVFATASYTVEDDLTILIKTEAPYATLINDLSDPYASIIDLATTEDRETHPIGTGPYISVEFLPDESVTLEKNQSYWDGTPKLDKVYVKKISDMDTLAMALQSGEIDVAHNITSDTVELFKDTSKYTVSQVETSRAYMLYYNLETLPDEAVRKAISMAIDKESICTYLLNNSATPAVGAFPDRMVYGGSNLKGVAYDSEGAKAILEQAGYRDLNGDGIREKDGEPLSINLVLYRRLSQEDIATEMQSALKQIGIDVNVTVFDNTEYFKTGEFDIGMYCIVTSPTGDSDAFLNMTMRTGMDNNFGGYSHSKVDDLLEQLQQEYDPDKRAELTIEIQQLVLDDYAYDFIGFNNMTMIMKKNVTGFKAHPTDYYQLNVNSDIQ